MNKIKTDKDKFIAKVKEIVNNLDVSPTIKNFILEQIDTAYTEGYTVGYEIGHLDGYTEGYDDGYYDGGLANEGDDQVI